MDQTHEPETAPVRNERGAQRTNNKLRRKSTWKTICEFFRHPAIVLLLTTIVTSILVPILTRTSRLHEARSKVALDLIERSSEVDRDLNGLLVTLEMFEQDTSGPAAQYLDMRNEQVELRKVFNARYLEFDRAAWWWPGNISTEASLLNLASEAELIVINKNIEEYKANLSESAKVLTDLWDTLLRKEYNPADRENNKEKMDKIHIELHRLAERRRAIILELAKVFAEK